MSTEVIPQNHGQQATRDTALAANEPEPAKVGGQNRALSYLRVSGKGQIGGDGFPRQREAIEALAATKGLDVAEEFRDEGISGTLGLADRPGLSALLDRALVSGITTIVIEKADRLARDLVESELLLRTFREHGIQVIEAEGGTDLTHGGGEVSPTTVLIRQVLGAVAQFEKSALVAKLRAARDRIRSQLGQCEGARAYGATGAEQAGLQRVLELAGVAGGPRQSLAQVAAALNREGVPTRTGRPWARSTVQAILSRHLRKCD